MAKNSRSKFDQDYSTSLVVARLVVLQAKLKDTTDLENKLIEAVTITVYLLWESLDYVTISIT